MKKFLTLISLSLLLTTAFAYAAQEKASVVKPAQETAAPAADVKPPVIPDAAKKDLKLAFLQRQLIQEQANRLQLEYEKNLKQLTEQFTAATDDLQKTVDSVYAATKADKKKYDIDAMKGEFVPSKP